MVLLVSLVSAWALAFAPQPQVLTPLPRPAHSTRPPGPLRPRPISNATLPLGIGAEGWFGRSVAALGDLDGDGVVDLVVGAPGEAGPTNGAAYVVFLRADRKVRAFRRIAPLDSFASGSLFGWAVCGLGDVNGDGAVDFAVSDPTNNAVWVVFLRTDGTVDHSVRLSDALPAPTGSGDSYGEGLVDMGDVNGDGVHDLAIVCGTGPDGVGTSPRVFSVALKPDGTALGFFDNGFTDACVSGGSLPDRDGNGVRELLVGIRGSPNRAQSWAMQPGGALVGLPRNFDGSSSTIPFGIALAEDGDLDGNGVVDVAIGDAQSYSLVTLDAGGLERTRQRIATPENVPGLVQSGDGFGSALAYLGDLDGDGTDELAIGAPYDDEGANDSGTVWIASARPALPLAPAKISNATTSLGLPGGAKFGTSVAAIGDLDGNGVGDLVVGAPTEVLGPDRGAAYVLFLEADRSVIGHRRIAPLGASDGWFGQAVCPLGDVNDDGVVDFAVSDPVNNEVWTVLLNPDGTVQHSEHVSDVLPPPIGGSALHSYGDGLAGLGDFNFDLVPDLAVICGLGSDGAEPRIFGVGLAPDGAGLAYVDNQGFGISVNRSGGSFPDVDGNGIRELLTARVRTITLWFTQPFGEITFLQNRVYTGSNSFGLAACEAGDVNGDGTPDLAVGDTNGYWLLTLTADAFEISRERVLHPQGISGLLTAGSQFGYSLAYLGDLDGDGIEELAIGAPGTSDGTTSSGAVWIASVR